MALLNSKRARRQTQRGHRSLYSFIARRQRVFSDTWPNARPARTFSSPWGMMR
jgi:hypothetical protein